MTLMFIGASTGGTGGGIKTTTFIALMAATRSTLRGQKDVIISNRLISDKVILKGSWNHSWIFAFCSFNGNVA